jgi:DNA-binding response OmpR family regulator
VASRFTGTIDLLLTDVVLPLQSGPELAAKLSVLLPNLQVVYMSGYMPESHGHRALPRGARLLHKPFAPGQLLDTIRRVLECSPTAAPPLVRTLM